jgi:CHAT domain-containing protein
VDPDNSLPFARFEGLRAAGAGSTKIGSEVTVEAVRDALSKRGLVLISCHGDFDEANPWQSTITAADGTFRVFELLDPAFATSSDLVVLGACEAARTRRSQSDEPLGFPGMLVEGGVTAVLAPLWKVDDFASLVFVSRFLEQLREGKHPALAAQETTRWLRNLKVPEAMALADGFLADVQGIMDKDGLGEALSRVPGRLQQMQAWFRTMKKEARPFKSPLDWAAFQLVGIPLETTPAE